jgi:error-prone DNA polymerase
LLWRLYAGTGGSDPLPVPDEYRPMQKLAHELESYGFLVSRHPLVLYRTEIERLKPVPAAHMSRFVGCRITMVGWLITEKPVETKHGQAMEFITLEDTTALYDATLFPDVYQRCHSLLSSNRPYVVRGRVEEEFGVATLNVSDLHLLDAADAGDQPSHRCSPAWYGE